MSCQKCSSPRLVKISAKCADRFYAETSEKEYDGYVPYDLGIGGGDYVTFSYCLRCGQIQGTWSLAETGIEQADDIESELDDNEENEDKW